MKCPNCGAAESGPGPFCMHCGFKTAASSGAAAPVAPEPASAPLAVPQARPVMPARGALELMGLRSESALPTRTSPVKTIRRISAGSVFKVTLVVYALLFGIFGCPLVLLLTSLGSLAGADSNSMGSLFTSYILLVVLGALAPAIVWAIAALIYNLIAKSVGGIQVELQE